MTQQQPSSHSGRSPIQGKTVKMRSLIKSKMCEMHYAIEGWIDANKAWGRPIPTPKTAVSESA